MKKKEMMNRGKQTDHELCYQLRSLHRSLDKIFSKYYIGCSPSAALSQSLRLNHATPLHMIFHELYRSMR
jgi:hypothetical protein